VGTKIQQHPCLLITHDETAMTITTTKWTIEDYHRMIAFPDLFVAIAEIVSTE
jgi:hypothetical protein